MSHLSLEQFLSLIMLPRMRYRTFWSARLLYQTGQIGYFYVLQKKNWSQITSFPIFAQGIKTFQME